MRRVPSSVTIMTACAFRPGHDEMLTVGCAISSLTTVSLDPPYISFNVKPPSKTLTAIRHAGGYFGLHFLNQTTGAAQLAHNFTLRNSDQMLLDRKKRWAFTRDPATASDFATPRIESKDVAAYLQCRLVKEVTVADHIVHGSII